jgi:excisionase family DNA binding protein
MHELLTVRETAAHLRVTERTVRAWLAAGRLKPVRLSRRAVRIRAADLRALVQVA